MKKDISWHARGHKHTEKSADWYIAFAIISVASAIAAILFKNFIFALLIIVGATTVWLLSRKEPPLLEIAITPRGILIGQSFYPYQNLMAFSIVESSNEPPLLVIDARKILTPHLVIPIEGIDINKIHAYLAKVMPEDPNLREPQAQKILEAFGF